MKRSDEEKIKGSSVDVLANWWDNGAQATMVRLPYINDEVFERMADAALAVLADVQESLVAEGIVPKDSF